MQIQLTKQWIVGEPLHDGEGGFGRVFDAIGETGDVAVAKFVPKAPGAERELLFGDSLEAASCRHVIPILDSGEHQDQLVIIMPKASESLRTHLETAGTLEVDEVVEILRHIATALVDLSGKVVHRDLKPENVLLLGDSWCLSDFGISRYADATTASDTRKYNLTRAYAAPEQWRLERATGATDIYALGVIAYELVSGQRPFPGPDFREQHLNQTPPTLAGGSSRLRMLVEECLYKPAAARPSPSNILTKLDKVAIHPTSQGATRLALANRAEVERLSKEQAHVERNRVLAPLQKVARRSLASIAAQLCDGIKENAPLARIDASGETSKYFFAELREGTLWVTHAVERGNEWRGPFSVIACASIQVRSSSWDSVRGGHSLWYCDAHEEGRFAWYETAFMLANGGGTEEFFPPTKVFDLDARGKRDWPLDPDFRRKDFHNPGAVQIVWPFEELDLFDLDRFVDRWLGWFGLAADGEPGREELMSKSIPERSWR
jgi:eukaryotic-like serine/threonine-protein kinase